MARPVRHSARLCQLAEKKEFAAVRQLLEEVEQFDPSDEKVAAAMIYCGLTADSALIRQFLDWGLDINAASRGYTLLHVAARLPQPGFTRDLIGLGADVHATDGERATPLIVVASQGLEHLEDEVRAEYQKSARHLLQAGADANAVDDLKRSALDYACRSNWKPLADLLLKNGASVEACEDGGIWALKAACEVDPKLLQALLKAGGSANAVVGMEGYTLVQYAAEHGWVKPVEILIKAGAAKVLPDGAKALERAKSNQDSRRQLLAELGIEVDD